MWNVDGKVRKESNSQNAPHYSIFTNKRKTLSTGVRKAAMQRKSGKILTLIHAEVSISPPYAYTTCWGGRAEEGGRGGRSAGYICM